MERSKSAAEEASHMVDSLGVAVVGAGMAGRAHVAAYRSASTLYEPTLPAVRLVTVADVNPQFGGLAARRIRRRSRTCAP